MTHKDFPPAGACDCHVHVVGPKSVYPLSENRSYVPGDAPVSALRAMLAELGVPRTVIVQPSFFGGDNRCMLDALEVFGNRARGVAVVAGDADGAMLDDLHARGVRALRINIASFAASGSLDAPREAFRTAAALATRNGWHVQTFIQAPLVVALESFFRDLPVPLVLDHFALLSVEEPDEAQKGAVFRLLESGKVWIKLSALYRIAESVDDPRLAALARRLAEINPDRVLWGTDWPHTPSHGTGHAARDTEIPYRQVATKELLRVVADWFPEPAMQRRLLVENPEALFGFDPLDR